tara:strand:+ start:252 stop:644 length:393 start_codon:yes stop_codon:yes gene_type:complete
MEKMINAAMMSIASSTMPTTVQDIMGNYGSGTVEYSPDKNQRKMIKDIEEKIKFNKHLLQNDISKLPKDKKDKLNRINHKITESISEIEEILTQIKQNQLTIRDELKETLDESINDLNTLNKMYNTICKK